MAKTLFEVICEQQKLGKMFAVATVVETYGSVSAKTSSKALIDENGNVIAGWVGGGCAESTACEQAVQCMQENKTAMVDIDLDDEMLGAGMPCGGAMKVYIEPVLPEPTLWLMGHGRVAESLCIMADLMGMKVIVNDAGATQEKFVNAAQVITDDIDYSSLQPTSTDYVVIATQHKGDHESISQALKCNAAYIALIASRKRSRLVLDYLHDRGFEQADIDRVVAPCGIDLGASTPEEIALCIISEITMLRRKGTGQRRHQMLKEESAQQEKLAQKANADVLIDNVGHTVK